MAIRERLLDVAGRIRRGADFFRSHYLKAVSAAIGGMLVWQVTVSEVAFDPIDVGESFAKDLPGPTLTLRIIDRVRDIAAGTSNGEFVGESRRFYRPVGQEADIEMPGGGATLQSVLRFLRQMLGTEHLVISGELRMEGSRAVLRLRSNKPEQFPALRVETDGSSVDALVDRGARAIIARLDPLAAAYELLATSQREDALPLLSEALRSPSPRTSSQAAVGLGYFAYLDERPDEAMSLARMALRLDPSSAYANQLACDLEGDAGRHQQAIAHCRAVVSTDAAATEGYSGWARGLFALGDVEGAIARLSEGIERARKPVFLYALLWIELDKRGRYRDVASIGHRFAARMAGEAGYHRILGSALVKQGDAQQGIGHIKAGIDLARPNKPQMAIGHVRLGNAYLATGDRVQARAEFERARNLNPANQEAARELAALAVNPDSLSGAARRR